MKTCILTLLLVVGTLTFSACSSKVKLSWNSNPQGEGVTEYRIYRLDKGIAKYIGKSTSTKATVITSPGTVLAITAVRGVDGVESDLSDPIIVLR